MISPCEVWVCSPCTCQMLGRIMLPSILVLPFHIALVFLGVSAALLQGAYSHTEKHMRGQRMRQKIASREGSAPSVFAPRPLAGAPCFWEIRRIEWCAQVFFKAYTFSSSWGFRVFWDSQECPDLRVRSSQVRNAHPPT